MQRRSEPRQVDRMKVKESIRVLYRITIGRKKRMNSLEEGLVCIRPIGNYKKINQNQKSIDDPLAK